MLVIRGQKCKDDALKNEWLESNLNGSYIHNNLLCHNSKSIHSLLSIPYQNKFLTLVSSLIEQINIDSCTYFTNFFEQENVPGQDKKNCLEKFYIDENPNFVYNFNGVKFLKSILLVNDKNVTVLKYKLLHPGKTAKLSLSPLISIKEYNSISRQPDKLKYNIAKEPGYIKFTHSDNINIFFYFNENEFKDNKKYIQNDILEEGEIYLSPGDFLFQLTPDNNECYFAISSERLKETNISIVYNNEIKRRNALLEKIKVKNEFYKNIILSSNFYIKKDNKTTFLKNSILNPEISFQVMINSMNILFTLKEIDAVKNLLRFFCDNIEQGLIPDNFDYKSKKFIYNSVDNSLWYLLYVLKFIEYTGDWKFIKDFLWEKIKFIIHNFYNNHVPAIKVDFDGLLLLDLSPHDKFNKGKIIEYMPGKHIALNSLWYNAVRITELLSAKFADIEHHTRAQELAYIIKKNFHSKFWNKEKNYFNYRVDIPATDQNDDSLRPYQIFTISLPFNDLIYDKTKRIILDLIKEKLLTPYGLLTLPVDSKNYIQDFNPEKFESAYNGTIHPYLLFHYMTAVLKLNKYSKQAKKEVKQLLINFEKKFKTNIAGFFPQFANSMQPYESIGAKDFSMTMSEYLRVKSEELASI